MRVRQPLFVTAAALWVLSLILDWATHRDRLSCELSPGSSVYGEPGWSWFPLGHTCTWTSVSGMPDIVQGPSLLTMLPAAVLALWGASLLASRRSGEVPHPWRNRR